MLTTLLVAGLLGGGILGGSLWSSHQNRKSQKSLNNTLIQLANTSHQREVADLRAAGLNPILSANGSGASVPSLDAVHYDDLGRQVGSAVETGLNTVSAAADLKGAMINNELNEATLKDRKAQIKADLKATQLDNERQAFENRMLENDAAISDAEFDWRMEGGSPSTYNVSRDFRFGLDGDGKSVSAALPRRPSAGLKSRWSDRDWSGWRDWTTDTLDKAASHFGRGIDRRYRNRPLEHSETIQHYDSHGRLERTTERNSYRARSRRK